MPAMEDSFQRVFYTALSEVINITATGHIKPKYVLVVYSAYWQFGLLELLLFFVKGVQ